MLRTFPRLSNWKMSKCSLFQKNQERRIRLYYSFWELNWIVTLWNWIRFWDQNSVSRLQKNKESFRQKLSISFQFWDTKYFVIKTYDLIMKIFSFHLHSFPGSLHIRFLVKRSPWGQRLSLWYWAKRKKYLYHSLTFGVCFCFCLYTFMLSITFLENLDFVFRLASGII